jgi:hypothetical protein
MLLIVCASLYVQLRAFVFHRHQQLLVTTVAPVSYRVRCLLVGPCDTQLRGRGICIVLS